MEKDTRVMMYRKGESRIFASAEAVPPNEGWQDRPVADEAPQEPQAPAAEPVKAKKPKKASGDDDSDGN